MLAIALSVVNADKQQLEVRLLRMAGADPSEKTLQSLVEDPGAQATAMISVALPKVRDFQVTVPVLSEVKNSKQGLVLTRGAWRFGKEFSGEETCYLAVRGKNQIG